VFEKQMTTRSRWVLLCSTGSPMRWKALY